MTYAAEDLGKLGRITLGGRIRSSRQAAGLALADTSAAAGISYSYLSDVERGRRLPTLEVLAAISSALDTSVVQLLTGLYPWDQVQPPISAEPPPDGRRRA